MKTIRLILLALLLAMTGMAAYAHDSVGFSISFGYPAYYSPPPVAYYSPLPVVYYSPAPAYYAYYGPRVYFRYGDRFHHNYRHGYKHHRDDPRWDGHHKGYR